MGSYVVVAIYKYTRTTEILWRKRGCVAALQVKERAPDPLLDRLLLFFWAHYIEGDPHLPKDRTLLITSKRRMLQLKRKTAQTPYLGGLVQILGR